MLYISDITDSLIYITSTKDNSTFSIEHRKLKECLASTGMRIYGVTRLYFSKETVLNSEDWIIHQGVDNLGLPYVEAFNYTFEVFPKENLPYDLDEKLSTVKKILAKNKIFGLKSNIAFNLIDYDDYSSTCIDIECTIVPDKESVLRKLNNVEYKNNRFEGWCSSTHTYKYYRLDELATIEIPDYVTRLNGYTLIIGSPVDVIIIPKSVRFIDSADILSGAFLVKAPKELEHCLSDCTCIKEFY